MQKRQICEEIKALSREKSHVYKDLYDASPENAVLRQKMERVTRTWARYATKIVKQNKNIFFGRFWVKGHPAILTKFSAQNCYLHRGTRPQNCNRRYNRRCNRLCVLSQNHRPQCLFTFLRMGIIPPRRITAGSTPTVIFFCDCWNYRKPMSQALGVVPIPFRCNKKNKKTAMESSDQVNALKMRLTTAPIWFGDKLLGISGHLFLLHS